MCSCPSEASILHADLDAFFASVEQRDDPRLRGRPVIVGGGVVLAASYEAKAFGVRAAMGGAQGAAAVPARGRRAAADGRPTRRPARRCSRSSSDTAPVVEGISIDEAFLDVRGMEHFAGTPREIAVRLRARVRDEVGLPITVGVASTKHLAKVASARAKPDGLLVVPAGEELAFLHPLPVERLWGVGPATAGQAARARAHDGRPGRRAGGGRRWWRSSAAPRAGTCTRWPTTATRGAVQGRHAGGARSARSGRSGAGTAAPAELDAILVGLVDRVTGRLRAAKRACRTVVLRLRFGDYARVDALAHAAARRPPSRA